MYTCPQAIFFDFDGVILDSAGIKAEAFTLLFSQYPQHLSAIREYHLANMGISRFTKFEWIYKTLLRQELSANESEELGKEFSRIAYRKILQADFIPGARELLKATTGQIPSFIASGTPHEELKLIVEDRELTNCFTEIHGTPKSKIEIIRNVTERFGLEPGKCWFIGDAHTDYAAARAAGLKFVGVSYVDREDYWSGFDNIWCVKDLFEVLDFLVANEYCQI